MNFWCYRSIFSCLRHCFKCFLCLWIVKRIVKIIKVSKRILIWMLFQLGNLVSVFLAKSFFASWIAQHAVTFSVSEFSIEFEVFGAEFAGFSSWNKKNVNGKAVNFMWILMTFYIFWYLRFPVTYNFSQSNFWNIRCFRSWFSLARRVPSICFRLVQEPPSRLVGSGFIRRKMKSWTPSDTPKT